VFVQVVGSDIDEFEYTPKPEFEGPFIIFNEPNEKALLKRFFSHLQEVTQMSPFTFLWTLQLPG